MRIENLIGLAALVVTVVYTCVGLPVQIRKNYVSKSTNGLSLVMVIMLACTFSIWLAYGLVLSPKNWFLVGSNLPGAICIAIVLTQFWLYRRGSGPKIG